MSDYSGCTPPEIRALAEEVELLPKKSQGLYEKAYISYKKWCDEKNISKTSENVLLVYFQELAQTNKASTLWSKYSMIKSVLNFKENINISTYFKLIAFLKRENASYEPKKASIFSRDDITKFITEAPDELFLSKKAVLLIGIAGACRTDELLNLNYEDADIRNDIIIFNIKKSKNGSSRKFVMMDPLWIKVVKKYLSLRPTPNIDKLFIGIRNLKATKQNMGHNTINGVPKEVAKFLKLKNINSFTGHTLRRTSATILAEGGGDILSLKRHGGWTSSTVAEGYIEESIEDKKRIARLVQNITDRRPSSSNPDDHEIPQEASTSSTITANVNSLATENNFNYENRTINITPSSVAGLSFNMTCNNCTIYNNFK